MQKYLLEGKQSPKNPERQTPMNKEAKNAKQKEPLTLMALLRRNPIPFGDVRKYYYAACIGTVILLTLCFHISVVAIALRTDTCEQLSNVFIVFLLFFCIATIVGHQMRSFLGYGISAVSSLIVLLLLQFYHGTGVMIISDLPEYGEVFRDGAKSTDFWILLAKVLAVVHLLLTIVFVNSTLKVKEEPALKGMNVQIQKIKDWLDKNNNSLPPGRRTSDYWFVAGSVFLWMVFVAYDPTMGKYDYWSIGLLIGGGGLVAFGQTLMGSSFFCLSALIRCTMYQWRFGICIPVVSAYLGLFVAILYLFLESTRVRKNGIEGNGTKRELLANQLLVWVSVALFATIIPVHEFLSVFAGLHMSVKKDSLPLLFFIPLCAVILIRSMRIEAYIVTAASYIWLWWVLNQFTSIEKQEWFVFDCADCHGGISGITTARMNTLVSFLRKMAIGVASTCALIGITGAIVLVYKKHRCVRTEEKCGESFIEEGLSCEEASHNTSI